MIVGTPTDAQVFRLVAAFGLDLFPPVDSPDRPQYVPYCEELGVREYQTMSHEMRLCAARLWAEGQSIKQIAAELHVNPVTLGGCICRHRELFPRRYSEREKEGRRVER